MRIIVPYFFFNVLIYGLGSLAQGQVCDFGPAADEQGVVDNWLDYIHLDAEFSFEPEAGKVFGNLSLHFVIPGQIQDTLWLDGPGIEVEQSLLNEKRVQVYRVGKRLAITETDLLSMNGSNTLQLIYQAQPRKGLYFIGWNDTTNRAPKQIWSQGQGIDNRHWIPHWDHLSDKLTSEIKVIFEEGYHVISNGNLVSKRSLDNGKVFWHYRLEKPHSSYLIMLGIGEFKAVRDQVDGINVELYYSDYQNIEPKKYWDEIAEMILYLNGRIRYPYPWSTFRIIPVRDYMHGAMENTTAVIMSDRLVRPDMFNNFSWVSAHEYAHQWFGNLLTGTTHHDHWLHESFATYYHMEWLRNRFGEEYYREIREQNRSSIFRANEIDSLPVAKEGSGSDRQYYKGAWVLDMFEDLIGQEQFDELISDYLTSYAFQNVTTKNFLGFIHERYGGEYDLFWQRWICEAGEIVAEAHSNDGNVVVEVRNNINGEFIPEPPLLEFYAAEDSFFKKKGELIEDGENPMFINVSNVRAGWAIDPTGKILAQILEKKTLQEFLFDVSQNQFPYLRNRSLKSMFKYYDADSVSGVMNDILRREKNEAFIEAILQNDVLKLDDHVLCDLLQHQNSEIRILAFRKMGGRSPCLEALPIFYERAAGREKIAVAEAGLRMSPYRFAELIEKTPAELFGTEMDQIDGLVLKYLIEQDSIYITKLLDFTSESFSFDVRLKAIEQLRALKSASSEYFLSMIRASVYFNRKLSIPARKVLKSYYVQEEYQSQIDDLVLLSDLSRAERNTVENLFERWKLN